MDKLANTEDLCALSNKSTFRLQSRAQAIAMHSETWQYQHDFHSHSQGMYVSDHLTAESLYHLVLCQNCCKLKNDVSLSP